MNKEEPGGHVFIGNGAGAPISPREDRRNCALTRSDSRHLTECPSQRKFAHDAAVHCLTAVLSPAGLAWKSSILLTENR